MNVKANNALLLRKPLYEWMIISERLAWRNLTLGQRFSRCFERRAERTETITSRLLYRDRRMIFEIELPVRTGASEFAERSTLNRADLVAHLFKGRRKHCSEKHSLVPREILERGPALCKIIPSTHPDSESESELSSPEDTGGRP